MRLLTPNDLNVNWEQLFQSLLQAPMVKKRDLNIELLPRFNSQENRLHRHPSIQESTLNSFLLSL
jgi:hypothetical protein